MTTATRPRYALQGEYVGHPHVQDAGVLVACALIASNIPVTPPKSWFENPRLTGPTPLNVDDSGRVFGHIAAWQTNHIGLPFGTRPPRSRTGYGYFHTGVLRTDEGADVTVGQLTLIGGHAPLTMSSSAAIKHYDDTQSAMADVHLGEDAHGIWAAGALRPHVSPEQVRAFRAAAMSGDWRPINGRLELVAVCAVNVPGFPIARAMVAGGHLTALVAAGASALAQLQGTTIEERLERIEQALTNRTAQGQDPELVAAAAAVAARVHSAIPEQDELALVAAAARTRFDALNAEMGEEALFKDVSTATRQKYAKKGWALDDGSFPIASAADVRRAVQAYGRTTPEKKAQVRRHIMRRARGLGRTDLIPETWKSASIEERHLDIAQSFHELADARSTQLLLQEFGGLIKRIYAPEQYVRVTAALTEAALTAAGVPGKTHKFTEQYHPRDTKGKFRDVIARLTNELQQNPDDTAADSAAKTEAKAELDAARDANEQSNTEATQQHLDKLLEIADQVAGGSVRPDVAQTLREGYSELGRFVASTGVSQQAGSDKYDPNKLRYSDLDPLIKDLIANMIKRIETDFPDQKVQQEALGNIQSYMAGGDVWSLTELMQSLSKMMRFLLSSGAHSQDSIQQTAQ